MKRIVPGLLIAGLWLLLLLKGAIALFSLIVVIIVLMAANEYLRMADTRDVSRFEKSFLNTVLALPVIVVCIKPALLSLPVALFTAFFVLTCYFLYRYKDIPESFDLFSRLVFGIVYVGGLGAHLVLLRHLPEGASWLIIATALTASSDTGAYFVGRAMGRKKLCPSVSPNKTVEGAIGGVCAGLIAVVFFALLLQVTFNWFFLIGAAILLAGLGIIGDLTESIVKRGTDTKDSGTLLAGHGGILDRVDSLLFVGPVLYYLLVFVAV